MKRVIAFLLISGSLCFAYELGLILGEPTGISYRNWTGTSNAIDLAAGWSFNTRSGDDNIDLHGAYLFNKKSDINIEGYRLPFYFGPGGRIKLGGDEVVLGFKVPLGLYYKFKSAPFSMFLEIDPGLNITPSTDFDISGGIGFRYIFGSSSYSEPSEEEIIKAKREKR